jgi:hypothetical protein
MKQKLLLKSRPEYLTGDGDWLKKWVVIGYEELCGDPYIHRHITRGISCLYGPERPQPIAVSLDAFGKSLCAVAQVATQFSNLPWTSAWSIVKEQGLR